MKPLVSPKTTEAICDTTLILAILFGGCRTGMILHEVTTPLPKGTIRIDLMYEISVIGFILNFLLPLAFVALIGSMTLKMRAKTVQPFSVAVAAAGLTGVTACAIAMYSMLATAHAGINLWSDIWWRFGR
jgi:hypothetical protein